MWHKYFCSSGIDPCQSKPCKNKGKCLPSSIEDESQDLIEQFGISYVCVCPPGFTGKDCEIGNVLM